MKIPVKHSITHSDIAHLFAGAGLAVIFVVTSFYFTNGYIDIGNDKYHAFIKTAPVIVIAWLVYRIAFFLTDKNAPAVTKIIAGFGAADWFVVMLLGAHLISTAASAFKQEAVWGQEGWNMGLIVHLLMTGMYLMARDTARVSSARFMRAFLNIFLAVSALVFILGFINRYSVYPIHMMGEAEDFISTIGNINWFCGYWSIWFGLGFGAYLSAKKTGERILYGIYLWICGLSGISCGASMCYLVFLAICFAALLWALDSPEKMVSLCRAMLIVTAALPAIRLMGWARPYRMWYDSSLLRGLTYGNTWLAPWVISVVVFGLLHELFLQYTSEHLSSVPGKNAGYARVPNVLSHIRDAVIGISFGALLAVILIISLNSSVEGGIWPVRGMGIFTFGVRWGNGRGGIWIATVKLLERMIPGRIFFGVGPDCFCAYAYSMTDMAVLINRYIGNQYLTCAHNEVLTMAVNEGIFGAIAYIGVMSAHIRDSVKTRIFPGLIFAAAAYIAAGLVGFMQILSTPWFFVVLGVMAGLNKKGH